MYCIDVSYVQVAAVFRWLLCSGGCCCVQVAAVFRWLLCSGGCCVQVAAAFRWLLCSVEKNVGIFRNLRAVLESFQFQ